MPGKNVVERYFMVDKVVAALGLRDSEGAKLTTEVFEVPDLEDERCATPSYGPLATGHCWPIFNLMFEYCHILCLY